MLCGVAVLRAAGHCPGKGEDAGAGAGLLHVEWLRWKRGRGTVGAAKSGRPGWSRKLQRAVK